jgi:hypothetical protein
MTCPPATEFHVSTTPYRAFIYADLTKASVQKLNTLPPSEIARISRFLQNYIFAGQGRAPSEAPWVGEVPVEPLSGIPHMAVLHSVVDALVADWNMRYDLELRADSTGPDDDDYPRHETWRWVLINGWPVLVPNHTLFRAPDATEPFDPFAALPMNHGLTGRLRIELRLFEPT